jgi:serine-threonine kinase receptor-associated protein
VRATDLSADGTRLVTGGHEKIIRLFDLNNPDTPPVVLTGHIGHIKDIRWDTERNVILSSGDDHEIRYVYVV